MTKSTRRAFVQRAAAAAVVPALISTTLEAKSSAAPLAQASTDPPPKLDPKSPLAKALTDTVRAQWGDFLTLDELALIESDLGRVVSSRLGVREFPLANGDEPDTLFSATSR